MTSKPSSELAPAMLYRFQISESGTWETHSWQGCPDDSQMRVKNLRGKKFKKPPYYALSFEIHYMERCRLKESLEDQTMVKFVVKKHICFKILNVN